MSLDRLVPVPGSNKQAPEGASISGTVNDSDRISVTIVLKRKSSLPIEVHRANFADNRTAFNADHGADPAAIALVEQFAHEHQLTVVDSSISKRRLILNGTVADMKAAFGVQLQCYRNDETGHTFRGRTGVISVPAALEPVVVAVLGLDDRPAAKPHFRRKRKPVQQTSFTPLQVAQLYNFPTGLDGTGQTIGIIELGGGYSTADLQTYFSGLRLKTPSVTAIGVDGGANKPGDAADGEVMLDIEVAGAVAPGANIAVYFAPNTDQGFIDAITDAVHDATHTPSVISISWGGPEDGWTQQSQTAMNAALQDAAALGVTVTVASGDNGSSDGAGDHALHVDFPASSPYALACGGTTLHGSGTNITSEVVWNETAAKEGATGGGVSNVFPLPTYQQSAGVPAQPTTKFVGRGVPDVSGDADPTTGYQVRVDGKDQVVGGTSAVAPLWAGLVALLNQSLRKKVGFLNPSLYSLGEKVFRDISSGNNDDAGLGYYPAKAGWDPCTGLGSPNGAALLSALPSVASATAGH
jgi:kumamolisin